MIKLVVKREGSGRNNCGNGRELEGVNLTF